MSEIVFAQCFLGGLSRVRWAFVDGTLGSRWWNRGVEDVGGGSFGGGGNTLKNACKLFESCHFSPSGGVNGAVGAGLVRAWMRSVAAMAAASAEVTLGMVLSCGKNSTVRAMRSARVLGM